MMATRRPRWLLRVIQWRRRFAQRRMLLELGWRKGWDRTVSARQYLDGLRR